MILIFAVSAIFLVFLCSYAAGSGVFLYICAMMASLAAMLSLHIQPTLMGDSV